MPQSQLDKVKHEEIFSAPNAILNNDILTSNDILYNEMFVLGEKSDWFSKKPFKGRVGIFLYYYHSKSR